MSHTNSTTNFGLPQFITTDKPAWLTDVNVAYNAIDTAMKNNQDAAAAAQGDATQALSDAASAGTTATSADGKASGSIASIADTFSASSTYVVGDHVIYNNLLYVCTVDVAVPGPWTGTTNWNRTTIEEYIQSLKASNIAYSLTESVADKLGDLSTNKADLSLIPNTFITQTYNCDPVRGFDIVLPYVTSTDRFANVLFFNPHGFTAGMIKLAPTTIAYTFIGTQTWTADTLDNKTFNIKPTSSSWGLTTFIVNYN